MNAIKKEKQRREVVHGFWISERGWKETDQFLGANPYEECMEGVLEQRSEWIKSSIRRRFHRYKECGIRLSTIRTMESADIISEIRWNRGRLFALSICKYT